MISPKLRRRPGTPSPLAKIVGKVSRWGKHSASEMRDREDAPPQSSPARLKSRLESKLAARGIQQNRFHQCRNLDGVFEVANGLPQEAVLLVDDIVDSGWTMTVIAALLQGAGTGPVYPVALASSSVND